ncbi:aspartate 1-decarboxylase [Candidatus Marinamargulisbacteria bacterium SCGC AG-439-L15]|nr:aspartate 1-decarboxylase [Candidatus Marinamargulisbacteria bacterium SCGC AG-439-L15]
MLISVYKSKITYATLSQTDLYYEGSITIDENLMKAANIRENERVQVVNLNNGERLETYVIKGEPGSKVIGLNGPAARKGEVGDQLFIISYAQIDPETESIDPIIVDMRTPYELKN